MDRTPSSQKGQQRYLGAFLVVLLAVAGYMLFLRPAQQQLSAKEKAIAAATAPTSPTGSSIQADSQTMAAAQTALPATVDLKQVQQNVRKLAAENPTVTILSFQPEGSSTTSLGTGTVINVVATGNYANLDSFLASLDNGVYIDPTSGQIRLNPSFPPGPLMIVAQLQLEPVQPHSPQYKATFTIDIPSRNS